MKKLNYKSNKGITLVALIITIIVLLVLAGVLIRSVTGDGVILKAQSGVDKYKGAQANEQSVLSGYEAYIDQYLGNNTVVGGGNVSGNTSTGILGKYVKYDANADGSVADETILWRVLRDDEDKVELITADALGGLTLVPSDFNDGRTKYNNYVELLVAECKRVTGITENIRNVGGPATEEPLSDTNTVVFSGENGIWLNTTASFETFEGATNGLRKPNSDYEYDWTQMGTAGVGIPDNQVYYYFGSRSSYSKGIFNVDRVYCGNNTMLGKSGIELLQVTYEGTGQIRFILQRIIRP